MALYLHVCLMNFHRTRVSMESFTSMQHRHWPGIDMRGAVNILDWMVAAIAVRSGYLWQGVGGGQEGSPKTLAGAAGE